jgi:orotate phosphoribosyltransferase
MTEQAEIARTVASDLLDIGAIRLRPDEPFIWSSGWHSPIYCDNRLSLSYPTIRTRIRNYLAQAVKLAYPKVEAIAGVATAGIPQGALIADILDLPFLYVRSKPKGHGMENMIEGKITPGQKIVLVEDLVSTGGSSLKAAEALQQSKFEILGMVAIFTYGFDIATRNFQEAKIPLICLSNYDMMLQEAVKRNMVKEDQLSSLQQWRKSPATWGVDQKG